MSAAANDGPARTTPAGEAAARWALRREDGPLADADERRFEEWLAEDPAHVAAYEDARWALDAFARHASAPELMAMREAALSMDERPHRRKWRWAGIAGALAASSIGIWMLTMQLAGPPPPADRPATTQAASPDRAIYKTAIGERLAVTLPDGSVVTLDTDSRLELAYSSTARRVRLVRGQALFEVAPGRALPFQVQARDQLITAVGTVFNVRLERDAVKVALVEGVVRVQADPDAPRTSSQAPTRELVMTAGEIAEVRSAAPIVARQADVAQAASWRTGRLIFDDAPLSEAVAEINRYTARPIVIVDPSVGSYRVTGVFRSSDPDRFSQAMAEVLPVSVSYGPDGSPTLRARRE